MMHINILSVLKVHYLVAQQKTTLWFPLKTDVVAFFITACQDKNGIERNTVQNKELQSLFEEQNFVTLKESFLYYTFELCMYVSRAIGKLSCQS